LKNSTKDSSCSDSSNSHNPFQSSESSFVTNSKGNSDDLLSSDSNYNSQSSTSNSSKLIKHVKFNDEVSKAKYKPNRDVFNVTKLASRQQKKLKKLHRKDPLNLHSIYTTDVDFNERNYIGLRQARRFHSWDSSGTESSDND
jgi:glycosylphosphatidylinositol transamidase (GPIT) subunit GPI8